ncbi:MAG: alkaline phosphatase family protein [Saprospiraceae bacterium]|nr:alkaline phosphatase family protein [Saprospiraceae bacterium]
MLIKEIQPTRTYKRIVQIEMNEISNSVIDSLIAKGRLPNFAKLQREWTFLKTNSETEYDKIEPWIQWVTVHTGKTYDEHKIFHLSDVHQLKHKQIWEALSENKIESGIIGSMNILRRNTEGGLFFSDPWAIQNETYPAGLRPLWDIISRRVQSHATSNVSFKDALQGLKSCLQFKLPPSLYMKMASQIVKQKLNPKNKWKLAIVFDWFLVHIFKHILKSTNYGFYTLFLNATAHYQHHYWRSFDGKEFDPSIKYPDINDSDDPMTYGYLEYDKILGEIFALTDKDPDTLVVILSALSQVPYTAKEAEGGMNYYRLNDHKSFAKTIGLGEEYDIFPMMSRDWQVKYTDEIDRQKALQILKGLTINGESLFQMKEDTEGFIFIETSYTKGIKNSDCIIDKNGQVVTRFNDVFTNVAIKSGHHTGFGNLWLSEKHEVSKDTHIPLTFLYNFTQEALGVRQFQTI